MATTSASWRTLVAPVLLAIMQSSFNLATTSASWRTNAGEKMSLSRPGLQFGHDVSVVENPCGLGRFDPPLVASIWPRRQRRGEQYSSRSLLPPSFSFNLATTSASWRTAAGGGLPPRPRRVCFNLATTSASWRTAAPARRSSARRRCFNLATTSASWRTFAVCESWADQDMLQFGHDVSVVENSRFFRPTIGPDRGFNLATTSASWRTGTGRPSAAPPERLQFGHDVSVVENAVPPAVEQGRQRASIWPRRQRRGELDDGHDHGGDLAASIWPRRQRRGEPHTADTGQAWASVLQFGHDVSVVENDPSAATAMYTD